MFIEALKIIGMPVAAIDTGSKIGEIKEIVVDVENGALLGFLVQSDGILTSKKALAIVDIRDWDPNGIVTESAENLVEPKEIVRLKEVIDKKIHLLGMHAKTESQKSLGKVENFLVDSTCGCVVKYYLKDLLGHTRIFTAEKVIKINKAIIFSDDVLEPPRDAVGATA